MASFLRITNLTISRVSLDSTIPTLFGRESIEVEVTVAQIEELRDTLKRLAAHSIISWEVFNTDSGDRDAQFATLADIQFGVSTTSTMDLYVDAVLGNDGNTGSSSSLFRRTQLL